MSDNLQNRLKIIAPRPSFAGQGEFVRPCAPSFSARDLSYMPPMDHTHALQDEALDWLLRLQQAPENAALQAAFEQWCDADEANAKAFRKAERVWRLTGQVAPTTREQWPTPEITPVPTPVVSLESRRPRRTARWLGAAMAACLIIALTPSLYLRWQSDYHTGPGETRDVTLADGSVVQLDSDSAIAVDYSGPRRAVRLLVGQAFFQVTPDKSRPFQVQAKALQVTVTGTAFNVQLRPDQVAVAVQHGSVKVDDWQAGRALVAQLLPGQELDYRNGQASQTTFPVTQAAAWRQGQVIANDTPISEVLEQIRRYTPGIVVLRDAELGRQRVTGVYDIRHPETALRAVVKPHGGQVDAYSPWLLVLRSRS